MSDQFIGKVLAEKYRIDSFIKQENLGNLYHATHLLMEKSVTVKILPQLLAIDEEIVNQFSKEARTVSRISHPNILNVTDYGSDKQNGVFIVYENAEGENLRETLERVGRFSLGKANKIVKEVASALTLAHSNGIIHQNLSSRNVLRNQDGVKVLNFGTNTFDINDLDYPIEKIEYLAPEQCTISGEIDRRSDVYALGVILFEMLAGEVPLTANNGTDLLLKQAQEPPPPINAFRSDLPNEIDDILLTALAKNPTIRYQSVQAFADELNQVALAHPDREESVYIPKPVANVAVAPERSTNNIWKTAFIVLVGALALGGLFVYLTQSKQTNPNTAQTDANGMPVQPVNPASGATEQGLSNMDAFNPAFYSNSNTLMTDGGGVSNPYWDSGKLPPGMPLPTGGGGFPTGSYPSSIPYEVRTGNQVYMDPGNGSVFMPQDDGSYVVMQPKNSNTSTNVNTTVKKNSNSNVNITPVNTTVKPPANSTTTPNSTAPKTTPTPAPSPKPQTTPATTKPKTENTKPPAATDKRTESGKTQDG